MWVVALVAASMALAGCTGSSAPTRPTIASPTASPAGPPNLVLYVSNQSFADDPVGIRVEIDDRVVVDDSFAVENQHTWIKYELTVPAGAHTIRATSDTGATASHQLELPAGEIRWAVFHYWYYPPDTPRSLSFRVDDQPTGFD
ncbi:MAG TPA: hypothetical protein VFT95_00815 [Micromonosporaceae bacterium]|nr:hypothetical protein [Micromonosporaceae bacterium]